MLLKIERSGATLCCPPAFGDVGSPSALVVRVLVAEFLDVVLVKILLINVMIFVIHKVLFVLIVLVLVLLGASRKT